MSEKYLWVAFIGGVLAIVYYLRQMLPPLLRWTTRKITGVHRQLQTWWWKRRAQRFMKRHLLKEGSYYVPTTSYRSDWSTEPKAMGHATRCLDIPDGPKWLTDYFKVSALETLSQKGQVVKATVFEWGTSPPHPVGYRFHVGRPDVSVEAQAKEIETNGRCRVYQRWSPICPLDSRFDKETWLLLESAPPCQRCWE